MFLEALFKLLGWILFPLGIAIVVGAWLGYGGFWVDAGGMAKFSKWELILGNRVYVGRWICDRFGCSNGTVITML